MGKIEVEDVCSMFMAGFKDGDIKNRIRDMADEDDYFENLVFELGCETLSSYILKKFSNKKKDD